MRYIIPAGTLTYAYRDDPRLDGTNEAPPNIGIKLPSSLVKLYHTDSFGFYSNHEVVFETCYEMLERLHGTISPAGMVFRIPPNEFGATYIMVPKDKVVIES